MECSRDDLIEILDIFVDTSPDLLHQLKNATSSADCEAIRASAHSLKGAASNICAEPLSKSAERIEDLATQGCMRDVEFEVAALQRHFDRLCAYIEAWSKN